MYQDLVRSFLRDEDGATAIEYALIAGIVSISIVAGLTEISTTLKGTFNTITSFLTAANT
ncbi:MAG: Flp family type IVb pilin [Proteobacteria bacterium]|nr:Flp family type IVb pilin [Pseudomonadota bacterium]